MISAVLLLSAQAGIPWRPNMEVALKEARVKKMPAVVFFYADW